MCAWSYSIFKILFTEEYWGGYISAPYLFMAPLLQMLFQVACNQFLIIKKTWPNMLILFGGALINIVLNFVLIPELGIEGASIATLSGYIAVNIVCVFVLKKMELMVVSRRLIWSVIVISLYLVIWRSIVLTSTLICTGIAFLVLAVYLLMYKNEIKQLSDNLRGFR